MASTIAALMRVWVNDTERTDRGLCSLPPWSRRSAYKVQVIGPRITEPDTGNVMGEYPRLKDGPVLRTGSVTGVTVALPVSVALASPLVLLVEPPGQPVAKAHVSCRCCRRGLLPEMWRRSGIPRQQKGGPMRFAKGVIVSAAAVGLAAATFPQHRRGYDSSSGSRRSESGAYPPPKDRIDRGMR
jgi:hypothetical protein